MKRFSSRRKNSRQKINDRLSLLSIFMNPRIIKKNSKELLENKLNKKFLKNRLSLKT